MNVKSYWMDKDQFAKPPTVGMSVCSVNILTGRGEVIGKIGKMDGTRCLVVLDTAIPWQALEQQGVGFSQFEDTED